jgi:hypothetical protein
MKKFLNFAPVNLTAILAVIFVCISIENCTAQSSNFKLSAIPSKYQISESSLAQYRQQADAAKSDAYDLTKSLPQGYVTDGSVDYAQPIQIGINSHANVIFPNFPILVSTKGLTVKSNTVLIFQNNSKIILKPTDASAYQIFKVNNVQNVKIYFANIQGDRDHHIGSGGEWGMGINISGSSNIQIINPKVANCWGDGIYLGKAGNAVNNNIDILYAQLDNNRRNGISIICSNGLNLTSPLVSNTNGTPPMAGIDIEPNDNSDEINDVNIKSATTFNNEYGIIIELDRLSGQSAKNVNVNIVNHIDDGSKTGLCYLLAKPNAANANYSGTISVVDPVWKNNQKAGFVNVKSAQTGLNLKFSNVKVFKKDGNGGDVSDEPQLLKIKDVMKKDLKADVN